MDIKCQPYIYEIEPTNTCPYKCYMCPRGKGKMKRPVGFMPLRTLELVLSQADRSQKLMRLHHFGEAVLHPDFPEFVRLTREAGFIPTISLNPASLNEELIERLIKSGPGIVCFSLDSLRSDRLYRIRGIKESAEYCLKMIRLFIEKSRLSGLPIFKIIQMVSLEVNRDERDRFLELKDIFQGDDIHVYISKNYGFGDLTLIKETDSGEENAVLAGAFPCSAPFDEVAILWNGDVVLCCYDYDAYNVIGNINDTPLSQIWTGQRVEKMRTIFYTTTTSTLPLCKDCYLAPHRFNEPFSKQNKGLREEEYILSLLSPLNILQ